MKWTLILYNYMYQILRLSWRPFIRFCVYQENRLSFIVYREDRLSGFAFIMYPILSCVYPILLCVYTILSCVYPILSCVYSILSFIM